MIPFSTRYTLHSLIVSTSTGLTIGIFVIIGLSFIIINSGKLEKIRRKTKLSNELFSAILSVLILIIIVSLTLGPDFILSQISAIKKDLISPQNTRFGLTVAENKQPYFINDWKGSFGPVMFNIPLYFWLFFIGAVVLFNNLIQKLNKKERMVLTSSYFIFLVCLIFSRYSPNSTLNGTNGLSLLMYFGGWIFFLGSIGYFYYLRYQKESFSVFKEFNFTYILYFLILTLGIIGARGGIRLIMLLGAISPVAAAFLIVKTSKLFLKEKEDSMKFFIGIIAVIIIIAGVFTLWTYYKQDKYTAQNFAPGSYQWQWQKAMGWIRDSTPQESVFAHWWDYGYWLQSIGERATILDGGNAIVYWNHLMGRYVLTGHSEREALEFLHAHNGTHLLIDSTEIGKYTAYSSIGSDENYDRFSWISTFLMDERQTQETKNETIYVYPGGSTLDDDIIWTPQGSNREIFLPKRQAGIGAIIIRKSLGENSSEKILQPEGVFVYNGNQYRIPLKYAYFENELHEFSSGLEAGVFFFPKLNAASDGRVSINDIGALMYLSERTIHSQMAELYLLDKKTDYFKLAHTQDSLVVENLKQQGLNIGDFVYYQGFQGPIKIWEIAYPSDIELKQKYLETQYPEELNIAKSGEYN